MAFDPSTEMNTMPVTDPADSLPSSPKPETDPETSIHWIPEYHVTCTDCVTAGYSWQVGECQIFSKEPCPIQDVACYSTLDMCTTLDNNEATDTEMYTVTDSFSYSYYSWSYYSDYSYYSTSLPPLPLPTHHDGHDGIHDGGKPWDHMDEEEGHMSWMVAAFVLMFVGCCCLMARRRRRLRARAIRQQTRLATLAAVQVTQQRPVQLQRPAIYAPIPVAPVYQQPMMAPMAQVVQVPQGGAFTAHALPPQQMQYMPVQHQQHQQPQQQQQQQYYVAAAAVPQQAQPPVGLYPSMGQ